MIAAEKSALKRVFMTPSLSAEEIKRLETPLILSTTYALNRSATKKICVGLQPRSNGCIEPIIKLMTNQSGSGGGIVLDSPAWTMLQTHIPTIDEYFKTGLVNAWQANWLTQIPKPIQIGNQKIIFTASFGEKAVVFDRDTSMELQQQPSVDDGFEDDQPRRKKLRCYTPSVIMQKPTFQGLCDIVVCVDERFRRLERFKDNVQKCVDIMCHELRQFLPSDESPESIHEIRVKDLIDAHRGPLKESVERRLDPAFVEHFFNIVFAELTTLCIPYVTQALKNTINPT